MSTYRIADLLVNFSCGGRTERQALPYLSTPSDTPDISLQLTDAQMHLAHKEMPWASDDECEHSLSATEFYRALLKFSGFMLHASALLYQGRAFLFSAPSGTGKSTHTKRWQSYFGTDKVQILNDDKPAVRLMKDGFYAFGTPWSGKDDNSLPIGAPLAGICFLEQAKKNTICRLCAREALPYLFSQTLHKLNDRNMDRLFHIFSLLLCEIPIYKMGCTISDEAVILAEHTMNRGVSAPLFSERPGRRPMRLKEDCELIVSSKGSHIVCKNTTIPPLSINSTGGFLFRILKGGGATREELCRALRSEYAIDRLTAQRDVEHFLSRLSEFGLV